MCTNRTAAPTFAPPIALAVAGSETATTSVHSVCTDVAPVWSVTQRRTAASPVLHTLSQQSGGHGVGSLALTCPKAGSRTSPSTSHRHHVMCTLCSLTAGASCRRFSLACAGQRCGAHAHGATGSWLCTRSQQVRNQHSLAVCTTQAVMHASFCSVELACFVCTCNSAAAFAAAAPVYDSVAASKPCRQEALPTTFHHHVRLPRPPPLIRFEWPFGDASDAGARAAPRH